MTHSKVHHTVTGTKDANHHSANKRGAVGRLKDSMFVAWRRAGLLQLHPGILGLVRFRGGCGHLSPAADAGGVS